MKRWFIAGGTIAVVLMLATFNPNMSVIENNLDITKSNDKASSDSGLENHNHDHSGHDTNNTHPSKDAPTGNPHFDQLTPEMQQALKDKLLLEGPMQTHQLSNGTVILPAKDRYTQMPVAVRMPDGKVVIKEYSVIPKAKEVSR
jgi:hypothetical protein